MPTPTTPDKQHTQPRPITASSSKSPEDEGDDDYDPITVHPSSTEKRKPILFSVSVFVAIFAIICGGIYQYQASADWQR